MKLENCPNCSAKIERDKNTNHHSLNAFVKCSDSECVYGMHWYRVGDIRELEIEKVGGMTNAC